MDNIARMDSVSRRDLFSQTAAKLSSFSPFAVEKDFWVCWMLKQLFSSALGDKIIFKGGTSLSKVFNLIRRFSEDIDLILNWSENPVGEPMESRSSSRQARFNVELEAWEIDYIRDVMLPEIQAFCGELCRAEISEDNPNNIVITYPRSFEDPYLRPQILLEIGTKAAWIPHGSYSISPYAATAYPKFFKTTEATVVATTPERSFWEKVTILHAEAHRPESGRIPMRYSRHYYDTAMIARSEYKCRAFADLELLRRVTDFKDKFYHCGWARYQEAKPGSMKLMPPAHSMENLQSDYTGMRTMIYGDYPSFDELLDELRKLETEINAL